MDTYEAGEVSLEPEGTAVNTQKMLCVFVKCNTLFIRWGYMLECDSPFGVGNQQDLSNDLEPDPFLNTALQRFTCDLYHAF